jgi:hypothetical protein
MTVPFGHAYTDPRTLPDSLATMQKRLVVMSNRCCWPERLALGWSEALTRAQIVGLCDRTALDDHTVAISRST